MSELAKSRVSRRTLAKGAAWTVPVAAIAVAAPSVAASPIPPRGMNGWVSVSRSCIRTYEYQIDGRGQFTGGGDNDRGIWTFVDDPNAIITDARIVFFLNRSDATFNNASGTGWSNLVRTPGRDGEQPTTGFYAYEATYSGSWTYHPVHGAWVANSQPYWQWNMLFGTCSTVMSYAQRTLTVNGETITFTRGPISV